MESRPGRAEPRLGLAHRSSPGALPVYNSKSRSPSTFRKVGLWGAGSPLTLDVVANDNGIEVFTAPLSCVS